MQANNSFKTLITNSFIFLVFPASMIHYGEIYLTLDVDLSRIDFKILGLSQRVWSTKTDAIFPPWKDKLEKLVKGVV